MSNVMRFLRIETFTGWHMVAVMLLFFGTIISVNLTLAYFAGKSWSGLLVENTYVASQKFNEDVALNREMADRGWTSDLVMDGERIVYRLTEADGTPVVAETASVVLQRPASMREDQVIPLAHEGDGRYAAPGAIASGLWHARITVVDGEDVVYRETRRLQVERSRDGE